MLHKFIGMKNKLFSATEIQPHDWDMIVESYRNGEAFGPLLQSIYLKRTVIW